MPVKKTPTTTAPKSAPKNATPAKVIADAMNFDDVPDSNFDALPAGAYIAILDKVSTRVSKNKGTPSIAMQFKVADGDFKGRVLFHDVYWLPKTRFQVLQAGSAFGIQLKGKGNLSMDKVAALFTDKVGQRAHLTVTVDPQYNSNKVKRIAAIG